MGLAEGDARLSVRNQTTCLAAAFKSQEVQMHKCQIVLIKTRRSVFSFLQHSNY